MALKEEIEIIWNYIDKLNGVDKYNFISIKPGKLSGKNRNYIAVHKDDLNDNNFEKYEVGGEKSLLIIFDIEKKEVKKLYYFQ